MRKGLRLIIPVMIAIALLVTTALAFTLTGGAADYEASLSTRTVTIGEKNYITGFGAEAISNGNFATLAESLSSIAPTGSTRYYLKLNGNVTLESGFTIPTNEYTEVIIDLGGYTLTSTTEDDAITVTGNGTVRILGDYTESGENGRIVYSQDKGALVKIAEGSAARVFFRHVDLDASYAVVGEPVFEALGGTLTVQSSNIAYQPSLASDITVISAKSASVEIKSSSINAAVDGEYTSTAVLLDGSDLYLENSDVNAKYAVASTGACSILTADARITADAPFSVASADTTVYMLGGVIKTVGDAIVSGDFNKANIGLYYGSGDMKIIGEDPSAYTVQADCSFALESGAWVMSASASSDVFLTTAKLGEQPTVTATTYNTAWKSIQVQSSDYTVTEVRIIALLRDTTNTAYKGSTTYNEHMNFIIDMNGHKLQINASGNFDVYGSPYFRYDGMGADGTIGSMAVYGENPMYLRIRCANTSTYKFIGANEFTYYAFNNCNIILEKCDATSGVNPFLTAQMGEFEMNNVDICYTGRGTTSTATRSVTILQFGSSANPMIKSVGHLNNVTLSDVCENEYMHTVGITPTYGARVFINGAKLEDLDNAINCSSAPEVYIADSDVSGETPFSGNSESFVIVDSRIVLSGSGQISSGGLSPVFMYGEGETEILTGDADLSGSYSVEDGYILVYKGNGRYVLMYAENVVSPSITMPAIFADGMVLQRNKELNIFGYCETDGATVEVTIGDKVAVATVENGEWCATFEPMDAAFGVTIQIRQTGDNVSYNLINIKDVNIGEVWVMSGQSNGNLTSLYLEDVIEHSTLADTLTNVRMYKSSIGYTLLEQKIGSGVWYEASEETVANEIITAIGYVAAAKIAAELGPDVPVAIMHLARGSTKIKTWLDYETLKSVSPSSANEYDYWVEQGTLPGSAHGGNAVGTVMYNNVIAPLQGFEVAGVMWYQGEGDTGGGYFASTKESGTVTLGDGSTKTVYFRVDENGDPYEEDQDNSYTEFFYGVEDTFRRAFGNDPELPFYVMQLSPFLSSSYKTENIYNLKMEQFDMCANEPNTYLVSLATDGTVIEDAFFGVLDPDIGSSTIEAGGFIHPLRKSTVGIRTADMILANEYGIKYSDIYTYPTPIKATQSGGVVTVEFDTDIKIFYGDTVLGFELYDGTKWVKATGTIDGNKVILSAEGVTNPTGVRYGCGETLIELGDGTFIEVTNSSYTTDSANKTITVTYGGKSYVLHINTTEMIRTVDYGNITNDSGVPMPLFRLDIEG